MCERARFADGGLTQNFFSCEARFDTNGSFFLFAKTTTFDDDIIGERSITATIIETLCKFVRFHLCRTSTAAAAAAKFTRRTFFNVLSRRGGFCVPCLCVRASSSHKLDICFLKVKRRHGN